MLDYTGAGARLDPARGLALDCRRWAWQPKLDGCYVRITTDRQGRIATVRTRNLREPREAWDLRGILAGPPDAVMHGELDAHTEAGNRTAMSRGWRNVHLFDLTRSDGRSIEAMPYEARYGALHRAQSVLEGDGQARIRTSQDALGRHRLDGSGKYVTAAPRDLRRVPIVPMVRGKAGAADLWRQHVELGQGEGLVAVRLDAPVRARGGKRKIKATDTIDVTIVAVDASGDYCRAVYGGVAFSMSCRKRVPPMVGELWSAAIDGWYESSTTPRFPRLVQRRDDISGTPLTPA